MKIPNFKIGDKILCINDDFSEVLKNNAYAEFMKFPEAMKVYTVRALPTESCQLEEIVNPRLSYYEFQEPAFYRWRFIKLDLQSEKSRARKSNIATSKKQKTETCVKEEDLQTSENN
ncbi:MAG: hypothetical protein ACK5JQ_07690 [Bacteroidota bacterium]|jgi:hypothetical protein